MCPVPSENPANPLFLYPVVSGLRKVYPYPYTFSTYAKERWYGRTIQDIFENEFRVDSPDNFVSISGGGGDFFYTGYTNKSYAMNLLMHNSLTIFIWFVTEMNLARRWYP